ncbi:MAG: hypothetical protein Q8L86_10440 [Vicinamibacterales bacterium]|nr:hypothetical protein [Vicinamibacterales bacterium]
MLRWVAAVVLAGVLVGCARTDLPNDPPQRRPPRVDAEKWFVITVRPEGNGCRIEVYPEADQGRGEVSVRRNWRVAWFVLNTCDAAGGATPRIEFDYLADDGVRSRRNPVQWTTTNAEVLHGRVTPGGGTDCRLDEQAPCGKYKYTVYVGDFVKDPEWEIVMY